MNISEPFIRKPVMTSLIMIALFVAGITCYNQLSVSNLPDVEYPSINVQVTYPGTTPETMANYIAVPLEQQFMTIAGVKSVTSTSTVGKTTIVLVFDVTKDIDAAAQDVQTAINAAKPNLPPKLPQDPTFRKVNPTSIPIVYLVLVSDTVPQWDLYEYASTYVGQRVSMIEGVAQVTNYGSPYAVRAQVDPLLLAAKGVTLNDVASSLSNSNPNLPTGQINGPNRYSIIKVNGQLDKAYLYNPIIVKYADGAPVRLQDIGFAVDGLQTDTISSLFTNEGKTQSVVTLAIQRQPGANIIKVADAIAAALPEIIPDIPGSVQLIEVYDRAVTVREGVTEVKITLILAFILVMLVIFIYLGKIRDTVIPSLAMPMSIVVTFIAMYFFNYTIDNLSLLAFTLAVGFIVDDAIVVLENIVRYVEEGMTPLQAALKGSKQIGFTILSMTLSLAAVFIPLLFMPGLIGKIFKEFSVTLVVVTLASGIISLTLTPMLCSKFIPPHNPEKKEKKKSFSEKLNDKLLSYYKPALSFVIRHPPYSLIVAIVCLVLTFYFFKVLPLDFIPDDDVGYVLGYIQAEQGTSSYEMLKYQQQIIEAIKDDPNIQNIVTIMGNPDVRQGIMNIRLKPWKDRKGIVEVLKDLNQKLSKIPGINVFLKNIPLINLSIGTITRGSYQYSLQTLEPDRLYSSADKLYNRLRSDPMFQSVSTDLEIKTPQVNVGIQRDKSSSYGITATDIENAFSLGYSQNLISRIETNLDQYNVILELNKPDQYYSDSFSKIYLRNNSSQQTGVGGNAPVVDNQVSNPNALYTVANAGIEKTNSSISSVVPLDEVINYTQSVGPSSINHISQFRSVTLSFNIAPGVPLSTALDRLDKIAKETLDNRVTGSFQGAAQTFQDSIRGSAYLLLFSIICIYIVLGILYESFIHPITILSTLPPATVGGLFTLWLFDMPLSAYGYLGIILLIGIVKKNGIMMVDYALDNIRTKGETAEKSIYDAAVVRFRPIMMTTLSAIVGSLPIAIGLGVTSQARRPLGFVIIGGLLISQMITLFITPVIYLYMERLREYFGVHEQKRS